MQRNAWFSLMLGLALMGCRTAHGFSPDGKTAEVGEQRPSEEGPDIPGYSIACIVLREATDSVPEAKAGCLIVDANEQRVPLQDVAVSWQWQYQLQAGSTVRVKVMEQTPLDPVDVIYFVQGDNGTQVNRELDMMTVQLPLTLKDRQTPKGFEQGKFAAVRRDNAPVFAPTESLPK